MQIESDKSKLVVRIFFYVIGFLIMTLGIAISVKSDMGVSPVSSIPYTMTCIWGIEMGRATILFHAVLVLIQVIILRKAFRMVNLLQVPVGILFGSFTTFSNHLMDFFPDPANVTVQVIMALVSTVFIAFGIFLYVPANFVPLAAEGVMLAVSKVTGFKFSNVKLSFDISVVIISLITCLIAIRSLGSVGIGTIIAAVIVGINLKLITRVLGETRDKILGNNAAAVKASDLDIAADTPLLRIMKRDVYTIRNNDSLLDALKLLNEKKVSGVPVLNEHDEVVGFISDGDIIRHLTSERSLFVDSYSLEKIEFNQSIMNLLSKEVSNIASKKIITVEASDDLDDVCYKLGENHLKKAPVMQNGEMIGIINVSNIIKYAVGLMEAG